MTVPPGPRQYLVQPNWRGSAPSRIYLTMILAYTRRIRNPAGQDPQSHSIALNTDLESMVIRTKLVIQALPLSQQPPMNRSLE